MPSLFRYLLVELAFWFILPLLFLAEYVHQFHNPSAAIPVHLYAMALLGLGIALVKLCFYQAIPKRSVALALSVLLYSAVIYALALYYCLVLVGLKTWGRVISQELITSYAQHLGQLTDNFGLPLWLALVLVLVGYGVVALLSYFGMSAHHNQSKICLTQRHPALLTVLMLSLVALVAYRLQEHVLVPDDGAKEPFRLTMLGGKSTAQQHFDAHLINFNSKLDVLEANARANYTIAEAANKKNVVLIIVDGLRPDHMSLYGYQRDTTPYLSSLALKHQATKVNNLRSVCGETACGFGSIFSSRYPHQVPTHPFTLQEVLKKNGYETRVILSGDHTNFYNLKQIYGKVDHYFDGSMAQSTYLNDDTNVLNQTKVLPMSGDRPTMFIYHLLSAHVVGKRLEQFNVFSPHKSYMGHSQGEAQEAYTNHYDNGVQQADAIIKELLNSLNAKNYLKNALVIVTADHGESLGEHGLFAHTNSVREELLRVPLFMVNYGDNANLSLPESELISQLAIAPTILRGLGINIPESWLGQPMQDILAVENNRDVTFFQMHPAVGFYDRRQKNKLWKYWINTNTNEEFAYDLTADPLEKNNLIWQIPLSLRNDWFRQASATQIQQAR
jgi:glucan phosphoethanolaminetransferase (alkaline phosphatase superfamily)